MIKIQEENIRFLSKQCGNFFMNLNSERKVLIILLNNIMDGMELWEKGFSTEAPWRQTNFVSLR